MNSTPNTSPLQVEVRNGRLEITIGIDTLAWAANVRNGGVLKDCTVIEGRYEEWACDVARAMEDEDEIGNSPLTQFLDNAMQAAADDGSEALK